MSRVIFDENRCKGCLLCALQCPKKIIVQSNRINHQGYKVAEVLEMEKCIGCTSCARICPDCVITVIKSSSTGNGSTTKGGSHAEDK